MSKSLQILFIDGNDQDREYYVEHLKKSSPEYVIFQAETGRRGLELYWSHSIDCVILELELPDMSGLQVVNLIQSLRNPEVPVIILTRSHFLSLMELAILYGEHASPCISRSQLLIISKEPSFKLYRPVSQIAREELLQVDRKS